MQTDWHSTRMKNLSLNLSLIGKRTSRAVSRIWARLQEDHVIFLAGSLAFFSVTALIPISAISLSLFASYINTEQEEIFYDYILEYIFPFSPENRITAIDSALGATHEAGEGVAPPVVGSATGSVAHPPPAIDLGEVEKTLKENIRKFTDQARNVGWVGLIFLLITGIWLFDSIDDAFNSIWRAERRRPFVRRFITFWTVLTLTPLLMVGPILIDRYIRSRSLIPEEVTWLSGLFSWSSFILPYLLSWLAIWLLYVVVPNGVVAWRPAAVSSLLAAFMWQLAKHLFATYVARAEMYQSVYGSLSLVAFVLAWVYYTWWLILAGLEMTSYLQYPDWDQAVPTGDLAPEISLFYSWGALFLIGRCFQKGMGGLTTESIAMNLELHKTRAARLLEALEEKKILARDTKGVWYPAVPLARISWAEVARALNYDLDNSSIRLSDWLESALQARGITGYRQDTRNLPSLAVLLDHHLDSSVATCQPANGEEESRVIATPVFIPDSGTGGEPQDRNTIV